MNCGLGSRRQEGKNSREDREDKKSGNEIKSRDLEDFNEGRGCVFIVNGGTKMLF